MNYYQLSASSRQQLRQILRNLTGYKLTYSSCYQLEQQFHILAATECSIPNLELFLPSLNPLTQLNTTLATLWQWAQSEIKQDLNWLRFENSASIGLNCADLIHHQIKISRSFLPLTESMLIINQTPDSFSDGGKFYQQLDKTLANIEQALIAGVSIIDIGAESTRPGASYLSSIAEIQRLQDIINGINELKSRYQFKLSLDSYKPSTIQHFLPLIDIVNDVSANLPTECLRRISAENKTYLFMHSLSVPADPKLTLAPELNPLDELNNWLQKQLERLSKLGFKPTQLISDPGIGFNKTMHQSWYLLKHIAKLHQNDLELLVGHSRKRFLNKVNGAVDDAANRDNESAQIACYLTTQGVDYVRLHNYKTYHQQVMSLNQLQNNFNN